MHQQKNDMKKSITLAQALKYKVRLGSHLEKTRAKTRGINSYWPGQPDFTELASILKETDLLMDNLISLKFEISKANEPIQKKIFLLSELKSKITGLRYISTARESRTNPSTYEVSYAELQINKKEMDEMISSIQKEINALQDDIDLFNATNKIEVEVLDF